MSEQKNLDVLNGYAFDTIRIKAKKLIGKAGFTWDDLDDIKQDITLDLLQRLPKHDPEKASLNTFINDVVDNKIARMIEAQNAEMRDFRIESGSLNELVEDLDGTPVELIYEIKDEDLPWNRGSCEISDFNYFELNDDIVKALLELPPQFREMCQRLMKDNIFVVAKEMGIPRASMYYHLKIIREHFEKSGLKIFF
jgi:RNA polymerase sigma-70 factor (ECF subfamily)